MCDRFEADWQGGRRPRIEAALEAEPGPWRPELLRQLLAVELAYRRRAGEAPGPDEYRRRFPECADLIDRALDVAAGSPTDLARAPHPEATADTLAPGTLGLPPGAIEATQAEAPADDEPLPLTNGTRVRYFGDYELSRVLGQGGMGVVYRACQLSLNRPVALKMIRTAELASDDERRRFQNEAEAVARLDHPNIVPIYEVGEYEDRRSFPIFNAPNFTISGVGLSPLWCPSDGAVSAPRALPDGYLNDPGPATMNYTSYAGNSGTWQLWYQQDPMPQQHMNGLYYLNSSVRLADITDGTSNTLLLGERAHTLLDAQSSLDWHWWTSCNYGDTLFCTLWPMNPFRRVSSISGAGSDARSAAYISGCSSLHPGGCNFAFADGTVRFLKETIQTWPYDQATGLPVGLAFDPAGPYRVTGDTKPGVYQALSTRNGGEVIDASAF